MHRVCAWTGLSDADTNPFLLPLCLRTRATLGELTLIVAIENRDYWTLQYTLMGLPSSKASFGGEDGMSTLDSRAEAIQARVLEPSSASAAPPHPTEIRASSGLISYSSELRRAELSRDARAGEQGTRQSARRFCEGERSAARRPKMRRRVRAPASTHDRPKSW